MINALNKGESPCNQLYCLAERKKFHRSFCQKNPENHATFSLFELFSIFSPSPWKHCLNVWHSLNKEKSNLCKVSFGYLRENISKNFMQKRLPNGAILGISKHFFLELLPNSPKSMSDLELPSKVDSNSLKTIFWLRSENVSIDLFEKTQNRANVGCFDFFSNFSTLSKKLLPELTLTQKRNN